MASEPPRSSGASPAVTTLVTRPTAPANGAAKGSYDRVPPHNLDAEVSVLGGMLLSKDAIAEVSELIGPEDFYRGAHRTMFEAIRDLYDRGEPVDSITLADALAGLGQLDDVGGAIGILDIVDKVPTAANALYYAKIVAEQAMRRRLIDAGTLITKLGYEPTTGVAEAVDTAEAEIFAVAQHGRSSGQFIPMKRLLRDTMDTLEKLQEQGSAITGLASGFLDFDSLTAGLQPGNLVILAARPAMGKCVAGDTLVVNPATGERARIADLVERGQGGAAAHVLSVDDRLRLRSSPVTGFFDSGVQPVFRVRTRMGREIVLTATHPLLTVLGWRTLADLQPGDRIATPRRLPAFGDRAMPEPELVLLAYLLGDGGLTQSSPRLSATNPAVVADARAQAAALGLSLVGVGPSQPHDYRIVARRGQGNRLTARLRELGVWGKGAHAKELPPAVFQLPRAQVARFLNRLFATDGTAWVASARGGKSGSGYGRIGYSSVSRALIAGVQHLLLRFGINASVRARSVRYAGTVRPAWELEVMDADGIRRFVTEIGIIGKEGALDRLSALIEGRAENPQRDTLSGDVWQKVLEAKERAGLSWAATSRRAGKPSSHNRHVHVRSPQRVTVGLLGAVLDSESLSDLGASDVWWDEIVAIEPAGSERVYDLGVSGDHNFVAADIVVHNSTLVTNIASHVAVELRKPVVLFSLEMSTMELVQRLLSAEARIDSKRLKTGDLEDRDWIKLSQATGRLAEAPLFLDDNSAINLMEIRSKCRRLKQEHGLSLVIVDYLQLMQSHRRVENRVQEVSELSRGLKVLAKELSVPVVALSQLSRKPEDRTDRRPQLADLRESGSIEQDADIVCFIYRDEVYNEESAAKGEAELIVAKHRNGPLKTVRLSFLGHHSRFANMARGMPPGAPAPL